MSELKKELQAEKEKCKNLQNDLTTFMEKEGRIAKTLASVSDLKFIKYEYKYKEWQWGNKR